MKKVANALILLLLCMTVFMFVACNNTRSYVITFDDGSDTKQFVEIKVGNSLSEEEIPVAVTKDGMTFDGWFVGDTRIEAGYTPTSNVKAVAKYIPIKITVVYEVIPDGLDDLDARVDATISSMQSLLESKGYIDSTFTKSTASNGNITIQVEVLDVEDPERILFLIGRPCTLEFKGEDDRNAENLIVGREHLESAYITHDANDNYAVGLQFNREGTEKLSKVTSEYLNKVIYIYIDGERYTQVNVNSQITNGIAIITSGSQGYTYQEANDFAMRLNSGTFKVNIRQIGIS